MSLNASTFDDALDDFKLSIPEKIMLDPASAAEAFAETEAETEPVIAQTEAETSPVIAQTEAETLPVIAQTEAETVPVAVQTEAETAPVVVQTEAETAPELPASVPVTREGENLIITYSPAEYPTAELISRLQEAGTIRDLNGIERVVWARS